MFISGAPFAALQVNRIVAEKFFFFFSVISKCQSKAGIIIEFSRLVI